MPAPDLAALDAEIKRLRQALRDAADLICCYCKAGLPLAHGEQGEWIHVDDDGEWDCDAGPVHDDLLDVGGVVKRAKEVSHADP